MINQHSGSLRCPIPVSLLRRLTLGLQGEAAVWVQSCSPSHGLIPHCLALSRGFPRQPVACGIDATGLWGAASHAVLEDGGLLHHPKLVGRRNVPSAVRLPLHSEVRRGCKPVPAPAARLPLISPPKCRALQSRALNSSRHVRQWRGGLPPSPAEASGSCGVPAAPGAGTGGAAG